MLRQVIHRVRCLVSERPHKIVACKNKVFIANWYSNLRSELSDMITQLWGLSFAKQCDLCIAVECHVICIALSLHDTYICSKVYIETLSED